MEPAEDKASGTYEVLPDVEQGAQAMCAAPHKRPLSLLPLIALIFFEVSGGPFGTEDAVAAAGPLLVILGFVVFPIVWSVPEALITAELATAFPENSGYVAWVSAAFGPFWGFQEGWWSWLSGVTDNSIYPVMLADNLRLFFPQLGAGWQRMTFVVVLSLALTYMNYRGLQVVGNAAMTTTLFIVAPFVLLCAFAAPHVQPSNWLVVDWKSVQWGTFLNIMFWNLNYWDSVSCLAGEVDKPHKTFPRALLWAVLLVVASYLLPTMAALGIAAEAGDWELGFYGKVAQQVAGNWLAWWMVLAAAASQIGQFQAEMSSDSYQLQGMAERGFLPKALARRSRHGTPTIGILLSSVGICCLSFFDFVSIVELLNAIYCLAELLEFAAFVALRVTAPNLPRPYKVPLPVWGLVLMLLPATVLLVAVLVLPAFNQDWTTVGATLAALLSGFVLYPLLQWLKESRLVDFADLGFDFAHVMGAGARTIVVRPGESFRGGLAPAGTEDALTGGGMAAAAAAAAAGPRSGRASPLDALLAGGPRGSYTITATGALHYPGDDVYDSDVFVDVASDGRRRSTSDSRPPSAPSSRWGLPRRGGSSSSLPATGTPAAAAAAPANGRRRAPARSESAPAGVPPVQLPASPGRALRSEDGGAPSTPAGASTSSRGPPSVASPSMREVASFKVVVSSGSEGEEVGDEERQPLVGSAAASPRPQGSAGKGAKQSPARGGRKKR